MYKIKRGKRAVRQPVCDSLTFASAFSKLERINQKIKTAYQTDEKKISDPEEKKAWKKGIMRLQKKYNAAMQGLLDIREKPALPITYDYASEERVATAKEGEGKFITMSPNEFFQYAPEISDGRYIFNEYSLKNIMDSVKRTGRIKVGYLTVEDGKVVGHEGRHNMAVARMLGVTDVPVYIRGKDFEDFQKEKIEPQYSKCQ